MPPTWLVHRRPAGRLSWSRPIIRPRRCGRTSRSDSASSTAPAASPPLPPPANLAILFALIRKDHVKSLVYHPASDLMLDFEAADFGGAAQDAIIADWLERRAAGRYPLTVEGRWKVSSSATSTATTSAPRCTWPSGTGRSSRRTGGIRASQAATRSSMGSATSTAARSIIYSVPGGGGVRGQDGGSPSHPGCA